MINFKEMTDSQLFDAVQELRQREYAVTLWYPEEQKGVSPKVIEAMMVAAGHETIDQLCEEEMLDDDDKETDD